jgi:hypothetical protein
MQVVNCRLCGGLNGLARMGGTYVGRPSPLGNPFRLSEDSDRNTAVRKYRVWIWGQIQARNSTVLEALAALNEDSILGCWCKPLECHADIIIKAWRWCKQNNVI